MTDRTLQTLYETSRRRVRTLLALWRQSLLESLPKEAVRLIEGSARPVQANWSGDTITFPDSTPEAGQPFEVRLPASLGLCIDFPLPREAEANLDAIVTYQIPVQTPFQASQANWQASVIGRSGGQITVRLVLCPRPVMDAVLQAAARFNSPLMTVRLEGAEVPHNLLAEAQRPRLDVDQEIRLGRRLILANALGLCALIAVGLHGQWEARGKLEVRAVQLEQQAQEVRALRSQVSALEAEQSFLRSQSGASADALVTLDALSSVIHDGAWLDQMVITGQQVELGGYADASARVLQAIDQSTQFQNAQYRAPVRAQRGGNIERFSIAAEKLAKDTP